MGYKAIDVKCLKCHEVWDELATQEELDKNEFACIYCDGVGMRIPSKPNPTRASYRDGVKRPGFSDMKKAAKLEAEMFNKPVDQRGDYIKEINEYKKVRKGDSK